MQMLTKICSKSESNLTFSYLNTDTEGANLRPMKTMRHDNVFFH